MSLVGLEEESLSAPQCIAYTWGEKEGEMVDGWLDKVRGKQIQMRKKQGIFKMAWVNFIYFPPWMCIGSTTVQRGDASHVPERGRNWPWVVSGC